MKVALFGSTAIWFALANEYKVIAYARSVPILTEDAYVNAIDQCYFAQNSTDNGSVRFSHRLNLRLPKAHAALARVPAGFGYQYAAMAGLLFHNFVHFSLFVVL
jgi:hypothetical protein